MKEIRIVLTSVGGLVAPGIINSLKRKAKENKERITIVGVDMQKEAVGFHFVDKGYVVPKGDSRNYISRLMEIVEENKINVIVPCSDEELLSISKEKDRFIRKGVTPICSDYEVVRKSNDKGLMLTFLKDKQIPVPKFYLPESVDEVKKAAKDFGYPDTPFVVKPRLARGSRGFRIIRERSDFFGGNNESLKLKHLIDILEDYETFPDIVLMEYLPGEEYSVDALAVRGNPKYIIPRKRIKALGGPSIVGEIIPNVEIEEMVVRIIKAFGFHLNVNIQIKYSRDKKPLICEINPRVSGTIVASDAAGANLLYYGIKLALGQEIPKYRAIRNVKMRRYFKELFIEETHLCE